MYDVEAFLPCPDALELRGLVVEWVAAVASSPADWPIRRLAPR